MSKVETPTEQLELEPVAYNVFVLQATLPEMRAALPHLLSRVTDALCSCSMSRPHPARTSAKLSARKSNHGPAHASGVGHGHMHVDAHTDGTDAHVARAAECGCREHMLLRANTINFAQRERDEMRDHTRASEIVSVDPSSSHGSHSPITRNTHAHANGRADATARTHQDDGPHPWIASLGQVFLGNASDVPLPPSASPSSSTDMLGVLDGVQNSDLADPFANADNDPERGRGFDVCIECHDRAPTPTPEHLRAAEAHLRALDDQWVERCRKQRGLGLGVKVAHTGDVAIVDGELVTPPRPAPSAQSVVHLPFPSAPITAGAAVSALVPFVEFLQRVICPSVEERDALGRSVGANKGKKGRLTRGAKVLIYSSDGYTESSVLALCLLMAVKGITLPEAYLELQVRVSSFPMIIPPFSSKSSPAGGQKTQLFRVPD